MMSEPSPVNAVKGLADRKQIGAGEGRESVTQDMRLLVIPKGYQRLIVPKLRERGGFGVFGFWSPLMAC